MHAYMYKFVTHRFGRSCPADRYFGRVLFSTSSHTHSAGVSISISSEVVCRAKCENFQALSEEDD